MPKISLDVYATLQQNMRKNLYRKQERPCDFGQRIRELRRTKNLGHRALAAKIGVSFTYIPNRERKPGLWHLPANVLICKLAKPSTLTPMIAAPGQEILETIRQRVLERPRLSVNCSP